MESAPMYSIEVRTVGKRERSKILMAVSMVSQDDPCNSVDGNKHFRGNFCVHEHCAGSIFL
jgi:hypothetical protein